MDFKRGKPALHFWRLGHFLAGIFGILLFGVDIAAQSYIVPAATENEEKLCVLRTELSHDLKEEQNSKVDQMMNVHIDLVSEAAEDGFVQGFFGGMVLMCEAYLHHLMVREGKE